jgi:uncharacterized membrane protein
MLPLFLFLFGTVLSMSGATIAQSAVETHKIFQWRPFLAPFHAVVLHFPIGFLVAACILEVYRLRHPSQELRRVTVVVTWLSFISAVISATFGLMRADTGNYDAHALQQHRVFGLYVPVFMLATLAMQKLACRKEDANGWRYGYWSLLAATVAVVVIAGHFGGNLTHGSKYLVENAPEFIRELVSENSPHPSDAPPALNQNARYYAEKVAPILKSKCYKCHGLEKQKGHYRLDAPEIAFKGGESGKIAIKPSDPLESNLVRLILLPAQHDDVMPPAGKEPLSSDEIMTLIEWIRNGAAFPGASTTPPMSAKNTEPQ